MFPFYHHKTKENLWLNGLGGSKGNIGKERVNVGLHEVPSFKHSIKQYIFY